jgi:NitT/TauT family transport system substrate-binding protein
VKIEGVRLRRLFVFALIGVVVVSAVSAGTLFYLNSHGGFGGKVESITIGNAQSFECDTLVYVAANQNFFAKNGLEVNILNYTSGLAAVNDLLAGKVDIAATAEFPLVSKAFDGESVSAIADIGRFELQELIGRRDHGIELVSDLVNKTVGVPLGTISEFYIGRFLELNGLHLRDVTVVNVSPSESVDAVVNGTVDALVIWQPYAFEAEGLLGERARVWPVQSSQRVFIVEVAGREWIAQHPDLVRRFLRSLAQAEDYVFQHPSEVKLMMQKSLNYSDGYMAKVWGKNEFSLSLDQSLVSAMEDEARWMIGNNLTNATVPPDFLNYIYLEGLEAVKPQSVNIIG